MEVYERRPYRHFKGKLYYVHSVCEDTETGEMFVSYQALYPSYKMYLRELSDFTAQVDTERADNITKQSHRFEMYDGNMDIAKIK